MLKKFSDKICLGTAQFGSNYGISNNHRTLSKKESLKILETAKKNGISFFDTAKAYGESEKILGISGLKNSKIITKIKINSKSKNIEKEVENLVNDSLKKLRIKKIYAILIHNPISLMGIKGKKIYEVLIKLKKEKKIKKIGISAYTPIEINKTIKKFKIDIVSFPFNPFDNRLVKLGLIKILKRKKIEIHVRSVFLQGLLLMKKNKRPKKFQRWKSIFRNLDKFLIKSSLSPIGFCLAYVLKNSSIDKVTIGVQSSDQLEEIFEKLNNLDLNFSTFNTRYINGLSNPNSW